MPRRYEMSLDSKKMRITKKAVARAKAQAQNEVFEELETPERMILQNAKAQDRQPRISPK